MSSMIRSVCAALILLGIAACASQESADAPAPETEQVAQTPSSTPPLRVLTQDELDRYLAFVSDMRAEANSAEAQLTQDPGRLLAFLTGGPIQGRGAELVETHGFTQEQMAQVHYNMSMAYGAMLLDANRSEIEGERVRQQQTIEAMKGKVSDDKLAAMKEAMESAQSRVAQAYAGVPPANKALLQRNGDKLSATFGP